MRDPGFDEAAKMLRKSPARFEVGEACMLPDGSIAEVTGEYRLRSVRCDDGPFLNEHGDRIAYRFGYCAREPGEKEYFWRPGALGKKDGTLRHLQLVKAQSQNPAVQRD